MTNALPDNGQKSAFWKKRALTARIWYRLFFREPLFRAVLRWAAARPEKLLESKKSDTVFVLGSGSSINDLGEEQWDIVRRHDTIGMNFWIYHPFVPTFLHHEISVVPLPQGLARRPYDQLLAHLARRPDYHRVGWLFSLHETAKHLSWRDLRRHIRHICKGGRCYHYPTQLDFFDPSETLTAASFAQRARKLQDVHIRPNAASLGAVLSVAIAMGYRNIVLLGVDLVDSRYWWTGQGRNDVHVEVDLHQKPDENHKTMTTRDGVPVDKLVDAIDRFVAQPAGVRLWIGSKRSALYPRLKLVDFADFQGD